MVLVNSGEGEATVLDMREFGKGFLLRLPWLQHNKTYPHGRDISPVCGAQKGRREPNKKPDGGGAYNDF